MHTWHLSSKSDLEVAESAGDELASISHGLRDSSSITCSSNTHTHTPLQCMLQLHSARPNAAGFVCITGTNGTKAFWPSPRIPVLADWTHEEEDSAGTARKQTQALCATEMEH